MSRVVAFRDRRTEKEKQMIMAAVKLKLEINDIISDFKDYWNSPKGRMVKKVLRTVIQIAAAVAALKIGGAFFTFAPKLLAASKTLKAFIMTLRIDNVKAGIIAFGVAVKSIEFLAKSIMSFLEAFKYKSNKSYTSGYGSRYGWDGIGY